MHRDLKVLGGIFCSGYISNYVDLGKFCYPFRQLIMTGPDAYQHFVNAFIYLNTSYGREDAVRKAQEFGWLRVMRRRISV